MDNSDVIAAIATPPGKGGISVVRISGNNLEPIANVLLGKLPPPRYAQINNFLDHHQKIIDQGIALYFPAPHSYTGEDVLELQGHGGPAVVNLLLNQCIAAGARLAQPGEFTLRAYLNEKIDLLQAESVADIIDASTSEAARCAIRSLQGTFSSTINTLVRLLIELRMFIEATLDFPEEEIDVLQILPVQSKLEDIRTQLTQVLESAKQGRLLQEGITIVLVGQPNVGKSSLLNQLTGEDAAIVTDIPGTTRDTIRQTITLEGIPVHIIDTAGLRVTTDVVEKAGIERTYAAVQKADVIIWLKDQSKQTCETKIEIQKQLNSRLPLITIFNKIDLIDEQPKVISELGSTTIYLSAKTGAGISLLQQKLLEIIGWQSNLAGEGLFMARQRHLQALNKAAEHLNNAHTIFHHQHQLELFAEELRLSQESLASITGEFTADDLLGEIFSQFCIGK